MDGGQFRSGVKFRRVIYVLYAFRMKARKPANSDIAVARARFQAVLQIEASKR